MKKDTFNKLTIDEQLKYFNQELAKGNSLTSICKSIEIGRSTVSDRFKKINYKFNKDTNQYEMIKNNGSNTNVIIKEKSNNSNNVSATDTVNEVINISSEDIKKNLLELATNYEIIQKIIDDYKCNTSVVKKQIIIDLPQAESKLITWRINQQVVEIFNEFANKNNQFKKVDLLSQALLDFVNKYE